MGGDAQIRYRSPGTLRTSAYGFPTRGAFAAVAATATTIPALINKSRLFKKGPRVTPNIVTRQTTQRPSGLRTRISSPALLARAIAARKIFAALRYRCDATSALSQNLRGVPQRRCFVVNGMRRVLPAVGPFAGGLNLPGAAFELLSGGADQSAHVPSQAEIDAVPNERCLPD